MFADPLKLNTCTKEVFEKQYLPLLKSKKIDHYYLSDKKHWTKRSSPDKPLGTVNIYEKELVHEQIFANFDGFIYQLTVPKPRPAFAVVPGHSKKFTCVFDSNNFAAVKPEAVVEKPTIGPSSAFLNGELTPAGDMKKYVEDLVAKKTTPDSVLTAAKDSLQVWNNAPWSTQSESDTVKLGDLQTANSKLAELEEPLFTREELLAQLVQNNQDQGQYDTEIDWDNLPLNKGTQVGVIKGTYYPTDPDGKVLAMPVNNSFADIDTSSGFAQFVESRVTDMKQLMGSKAKDYHRGGNVFHNFDSVARSEDQEPERALWGMVSKQLNSARDLVKDVEAGQIPSLERSKEVLEDIRVYMFFLEGLIIRRNNQYSGNQKAA